MDLSPAESKCLPGGQGDSSEGQFHLEAAPAPKQTGRQILNHIPSPILTSVQHHAYRRRWAHFYSID